MFMLFIVAFGLLLLLRQVMYIAMGGTEYVFTGIVSAITLIITYLAFRSGMRD